MAMTPSPNPSQSLTLDIRLRKLSTASQRTATYVVAAR